MCVGDVSVYEHEERGAMMNTLLRCQDEQGHWNLEGIEFAIQERIGEPQDFIGRVEELQYLYKWAGNIERGISKSIAFLGRRKIGKSLILFSNPN